MESGHLGWQESITLWFDVINDGKIIWKDWLCIWTRSNMIVKTFRERLQNPNGNSFVWNVSCFVWNETKYISKVSSYIYNEGNVLTFSFRFKGKRKLLRFRAIRLCFISCTIVFRLVIHFKIHLKNLSYDVFRLIFHFMIRLVKFSV